MLRINHRASLQLDRIVKAINKINCAEHAKTCAAP